MPIPPAIRSERRARVLVFVLEDALADGFSKPPFCSAKRENPRPKGPSISSSSPGCLRLSQEVPLPTFRKSISQEFIDSPWFEFIRKRLNGLGNKGPNSFSRQ